MNGKYDLREINILVSKKQIGKFIEEYENKFEDQIVRFAKRIETNIKKNRIILISGSSSSGKTTLSLKLKAVLKENGIEAQAVSLDDFFLEKERTPKKKDGTPDYESVYALDLDRIDKAFCGLLEEGKCAYPKFEFVTGKTGSQNKEVVLKPNGIIMIEGLHALNDLITSLFPKDSFLKAYIDLTNDLYLDEELLLEKKDIRFLRRLIRDFSFRASSPENTFSMWADVLEGDNKYVLPFADRADVKLSTFFPYDAGVLKPYAVQLLRQVDPNSRYCGQANALLQKLSGVEMIDEEYLPSTALIREFIGGSEYYPDNTVRKNRK